tara:strand:+ start:7623 stop:7892 length:270 start_codon:yes stop_codon:yes gene_type:complete
MRNQKLSVIFKFFCFCLSIILANTSHEVVQRGTGIKLADTIHEDKYSYDNKTGIHQTVSQYHKAKSLPICPGFNNELELSFCYMKQQNS